MSGDPLLKSPAPIVGIDIGGTKCAISTLESDGTIRERVRFSTAVWSDTCQRLLQEIDALELVGEPWIGVSAGTLRAPEGLISDMPNLPGWDDIPIKQILQDHCGGRAFLMNDAKACALAEWKFGAGQGCRHLAFLTAGTGMGAGLILNGSLYLGTGNAGEVGHMRIAPDGPYGHGKHGSFEGWCSGGGIGRYAQSRLLEQERDVGFCGRRIDQVTTRDVAEAAAGEDPLALDIFAEVGRHLGQALATLIDTLALERVVIGSLYPRCRQWLDPTLWATLRDEALPYNLERCHIVPAQLGEEIGNYGAISVVRYFTEWQNEGGGA